jgi:hypothetical protein
MLATGVTTTLRALDMVVISMLVTHHTSLRMGMLVDVGSVDAGLDVSTP